ncbi:heavy metal sensor histidine kinase [Salmonella enterica subsp. enterica serovar Weltevreden]|uniref:heavy metal sensor histidine kinase n=1 Tax=Salmonella enterica TaxID=28901 RepID=UPI0020C3D40B|nr:heavy metal sensor histidine kinase [Salmonella enterica]UTL47982.1 heavy metal sensor histidine kinase [Salmonella enterica subsp. enterica serovar Weltevreden]
MVKLSMTLRLTISFIAILILACTGISWTLYNALSKELTYRDDMTLINRAAQMQQLLLDGARPENLPLYFNRMVDTKQDILLIHSATGHNVAINHSGIPDQRFNEIPLTKNITRETFTIARLATERRQMLTQYRRNSLLMSLIAILVCSALSPLVIRNGLRAITSLSRLTAATDSGTLRQPLAEQALPVELRPLGQALNTMRQKLSDDFERLNQFADDLAHELRTPVNILLGKNQVMLSQERSAEEYQQALVDNIEELEGLSRLTENILFLARAEHQNIAVKKQPVSLNALVENMLDYLSPLAEEKRICFINQCQGTVWADEILLQRVLSNLLTNAIRYSDENAVIRIESAYDDNVAEIRVANPGSHPADADKLFRRFWRGDNARHTAGFGLGLSLVNAIALLHGGAASYRYADEHNIFSVRLPDSGDS